MMQFRYKITKDILWGCYTLHVQYWADTRNKWKKFSRKDLFDVCLKLTGDSYIFNRPSFDEQLHTINNCIKKCNSTREFVTAYILSILRDKNKKMIKYNKNKDLRKMIDKLANNTWSDVIVIDENKISEE